MYSTSNAKTCMQALNIVVKQMSDLSMYDPIAYKLGGSTCSCCRSEYFDLICKLGDRYKFLRYEGYINHAKDCTIMRCSCNKSFIWKNIEPKERKYDDFFPFERFVSIANDTWYDNLKYHFEQQRENENIYEYNEDEESYTTKNYAYYFK